MKTYKIKLKLTGSMTQLPDSQKLFGALVYLFSQVHGPDKTAAWVQAVLHREFHLALSNVMPEGYLPTPQDYLIDQLHDDKITQDDLKQRRATIKGRSYIKTSDLNDVLNNLALCENVPYVKLTNRQQLRTSIDSLRLNISSLDNSLYSVPCTIPLEIRSDRGKEQSISDYYFYLQTDQQQIESDLIEMVKSAAKKAQLLILGNRASQGLNTYKLCDVLHEKEFPVNHKGKFLNMGMLLPKDIDFVASTLKLFTSQRRPFEMAGGWNKQIPKQFISFVSEGSVIFAPNGPKSAGTSVKSPFNETRDIVFGNAFLYPITPFERGTKDAES